MSVTADLMVAASTEIMNALTYQGFFKYDYDRDENGDVVKVGNMYTIVNGVRVEVIYTKPEIKLIIGDNIRPVVIVRACEYTERDIRGIASNVFTSATMFARMKK